MTLKIFNTMGRKKQVFRPLKEGVVTMYNCGLTVYDYAHIGNLRSYTLADMIRRYLEYRGYGVRQVMNFTDVGHMVGDADAGLAEDKMEKAAKREKRTVWDVAQFYINAFLEDSKKMNFLEPHVRPRATEHIKEMIAIIEALLKKGYAYEVNGSVYYDISKFRGYGKLSGNTIEQLKAGAGGRVEENPEKKNPLDFALWVNDPQHVMRWDSPFSVGYPGWHIECSAMSMKYLGETLDMHTGGVDNIFPHHECEIAQSEGATGKRFVNYWLHVTHLMVNGEKMSKSLGNFYTLRDLEKKGYTARALRYLLLSAHYRTQLNFTEEAMKAAEKTVAGLLDFMDRLGDAIGGTRNDALRRKAAETEKLFEKYMDDDFNMPMALAAIFDLVRETNAAVDGKRVSGDDASAIRATMTKFDRVLGVLEAKRIALPEEVKKLIGEREAARKAGDWKKADGLRKRVAELGFVLEDTESGVRWKKAQQRNV